MGTIRLTVTPELKREIDYLRMVEYPALTDAEIVKVAVGAQAVKSKTSKRRGVDYDDSNPGIEELMYNAAKSFELEDREGDEKPFWDETKLKPLRLRNYV